MGKELERVRLMLGEEALAKLRNAHVFVAGCGGVGSYAIEALARSGVGHLTILDKDVVAKSNLNRQIMATYQTIGQSKVEMMKERIATYSDCVVDTYELFFSKETTHVLEGVDFAIDAIDTVSAKLDFIEACHAYGIPFISSLGMGNRLDPSKVKNTLLYKTEGDPLARSVRSLARKRGMLYDIPVIVSTEKPITQNQVVNPEGETMKDRIPPSSAIFVPAQAGLLAASIAVRTMIGEVVK